MDEREALECGVKTAALQTLPPILISKINAIALTLQIQMVNPQK
jgi:hypothetical protein